MLTQTAVLEAIENGKSSEAVDNRDYGRLAAFFAVKDVKRLGFEVMQPDEWKPTPWTKEAVLEQFRKDVEFGFQKALDQRGISACCMHSVVKMWLWVLEDPLQHDDAYAQYGLPLLKKVAVKYGFPNEIGDDYGNESQYAA